jgi:hypothetical protein
LSAAQAQGAAAYTPIVDDLIASDCRDINRIQQILDGVLDFAGHPHGLTLFRRLCRHLWHLDRQAAVDYVQIYRACWDPEDERPWQQTPGPNRADVGR